MNDEIKEILDNIDIWYKENDLDYSRWFGLEELKQLKDYITNLQEEIERLNNIITKLEIYLLNNISNREPEKETLGQCIVYKTLSLTLEKLQELKQEN